MSTQGVSQAVTTILNATCIKTRAPLVAAFVKNHNCVIFVVLICEMIALRFEASAVGGGDVQTVLFFGLRPCKEIHEDRPFQRRMLSGLLLQG